MSTSPVKQSDTFRQQLAQTNSELQALDHELPAMQARLDTLRPLLPQYSVGPITDAQVEFGELGERISKAESRRDHLSRHEIPVLEKQLDFSLRAEGAEREIRAATTERAAALEELNACEARRDQVLVKLAAIQNEIDTPLALAVEAEQSAAAAYARAVVEGNEETQRSAEEQCRAAQDAVDDVQHQAARKQVVLGALQDEVTRLDAAKAGAEGRVAAAQTKLSFALEAKHAAEWDATVEQLARIGARLGAARRLRGESLYEVLRELNVMRMMPKAASMRIDEVTRLVDGVVIPAEE